jgi:hypothetical protein
MEEKSKKGRKKKFNDLVKASFYIERELYDQVNELVELSNEFKDVDSFTFSIIARQCLATNIPKLLNAMKEKMGRIDDQTRQEEMDKFFKK